jgi:hypothetical protein
MQATSQWPVAASAHVASLDGTHAASDKLWQAARASQARVQTPQRQLNPLPHEAEPGAQCVKKWVSPPVGSLLRS